MFADAEVVEQSHGALRDLQAPNWVQSFIRNVMHALRICFPEDPPVPNLRRRKLVPELANDAFHGGLATRNVEARPTLYVVQTT